MAVKMRRGFCCFLAALLALALPAGIRAEAGDPDTIVTIITAPDQAGPERPPCFPDPAEQYIQLPEGENIAEGKPVQASAHNDVYVSRNLNDGKTDTYWESKGFPAEIVIDLEGTYTISAAAVCLNPSAIWEPRTQEIVLEAGTDGEHFTEIVPAAAYTFDAAYGNRIRIDFDPVEAAFVRITILSNTAHPAHSGGAQAAEVCIY